MAEKSLVECFGVNRYTTKADMTVLGILTRISTVHPRFVDRHNELPRLYVYLNQDDDFEDYACVIFYEGPATGEKVKSLLEDYYDTRITTGKLIMSYPKTEI